MGSLEPGNSPSRRRHSLDSAEPAHLSPYPDLEFPQEDQFGTETGPNGAGLVISSAISPCISTGEILEMLRETLTVNPGIQAESAFSRQFFGSRNFRLDLVQSAVACAKQTLERRLAGEQTGDGLIDLMPSNSKAPVALSDFNTEIFTVTGLRHLWLGRACQDFACISRDDHAIIATVADGASASPLSGYGARLLGETLTNLTRPLLQSHHWDVRPTPRFLGTLHTGLLASLVGMCRDIGVAPECGAWMFGGSTLVQVIVTESHALGICLGDGFFRVGDAYREINEVLGRSAPKFSEHEGGWGAELSTFFSNIFNYDTEGVGDCRDPYSDMEYSNEVKQRLHDEAKAFQVLFYLPTQDIAAKGVSLTTDGLRHTPKKYQTEMDRLVASPVLSPGSVQQGMALAQLVYGYDRHKYLKTGMSKMDFAHAVLSGTTATQPFPELDLMRRDLVAAGDEESFKRDMKKFCAAIGAFVSTTLLPDQGETGVPFAVDDLGYVRIWRP